MVEYNLNRHGFAGLKFNDTEENVIKKLGEPTEKSEEIFQYADRTLDRDVTYDYDLWGLSIVFRYNDENDYEGLEIFSNHLLINGTDVFDIGIDSLREIIAKISKTSFEDAIDEFKTESSDGTIQYSFYDIGLTLWILDGKVTNTCMFEPE